MLLPQLSGHCNDTAMCAQALTLSLHVLWLLAPSTGHAQLYKSCGFDDLPA